jgi:hypothetical protein
MNTASAIRSQKRSGRTQLDFFAPPSPLDQKFWDFYRKNPQVMEKLIHLTAQAKRAGRKKIGMKMLFEVIRWEHFISTKGDDFKLNNSYTSRYTRLLIEQHPEFESMFETRRIRS